MNNMPDTAKNALSRAVKTIVQYPIPAAIAAAGLVLLLVKRLIRKEDPAVPTQEVYGGLVVPKNPLPGLADSSIVNSAKVMSEQASSQVEHLSKRARQLGADAQELAEQAGSQVEHLSKKARQLGADAQDLADHLGTQVQGSVQEAGHDIADTAQKIADRVKSAKS
jgi:uncharacterized protein (DUF3084 family)